MRMNVVSKTRARAGPHLKDRMHCEERERNTSQVQAVLRCHEETWRRRKPCTGPERGRKLENHPTI